MRKLTINRRKTFVACAVKIFIYIETDDLLVSDKALFIYNKHFKPVGTISNGKTLIVDIPNETIDVMVAFSANSPLLFNTCYSLSSGDKDVVLCTIPRFSPILGNPFIIERTKGLYIRSIQSEGGEIMKDIFNGNLKDSKFAIYSIVIFSSIMFVCGIMFLFSAIFYRNCEPSARHLLLIFAIISIALSILNPIVAIYFVRRMDKYPKIARLFFKDYLYKK